MSGSSTDGRARANMNLARYPSATVPLKTAAKRRALAPCPAATLEATSASPSGSSSHSEPSHVAVAKSASSAGWRCSANHRRIFSSQDGGAHSLAVHTGIAPMARTAIAADADRRGLSTTVAQPGSFVRQIRLAAMLAAISATTTPKARKTGILKKLISSIFTPMNIRTSAKP